MYATATTTVSIYNDQIASTDPYQDAVDDNTYPAATNVIFFGLETTATADDPATRTPRVIRYITGRLSSNYNGMLYSGRSRLLDEQTGVWYRVQKVSHSTSPVLNSDIELTLDAVDAA